MVPFIQGGSLLQLKAVAGNVRGVQLDRLCQRIRPVFLGLRGKAVNQIQTDIFDSRFPSIANRHLHLLKIVPSPDQPEDIVVGGLHSQGNTVHAVPAQQPQILPP